MQSCIFSRVQIVTVKSFAGQRVWFNAILEIEMNERKKLKANHHRPKRVFHKCIYAIRVETKRYFYRKTQNVWIRFPNADNAGQQRGRHLPWLTSIICDSIRWHVIEKLWRVIETRSRGSLNSISPSKRSDSPKYFWHLLPAFLDYLFENQRLIRRNLMEFDNFSTWNTVFFIERKAFCLLLHFL